VKDLRPFVWYTIDEFSRIVDKRTADELVIRGYVLQSDVLTGKVRLVPWQHAASNTDDREREPQVEATKGPVEIWTKRRFIDRAAFEKPAPLVRRKPADRVDSLAARMMLQIQKTGILPGEKDPRTQEIVEEAWKSGRPEITGEMVRTLASRMLEKSERERKLHEYKKVTKKPTT
jgi:hypothetical protein